jgi:enoyl-CoA hydratase/carnithine racemase
VLGALRKPSLAVIAGTAHGPGLELALACDLRVAAVSASFALPQLAEGTMPFLGGTQRLPRAIGRARALDLLLTGRAIDAALAHAWGLVAVVAADDALEGEGRRIATALISGAPLAAALAKEAVHAAFDLPLDEGLRLEEDLYALLQTTSDRAEGVRAFLEHRAPRFRGA